MKILLFDFQITGHHSEYINHLINYIVEKKPLNEFIIVAHPLFKINFPDIIKKSYQVNNIQWDLLTKEELEVCERKGMLRRSLAAYRIMDKYALKHQVEHVFLLSFNPFQLALSLFRPPYTISGILFKQFYRMSKKGNLLRYYRKYFQTWFFTLNKKLTNIYILNDKKTVRFFNNKFNTHIFKVLPDPIPELAPQKDFNIYKEYGIQKDKKIFLHLGSLSERKGTLDILEAIPLLSSENKSEIFLLLVGKAPEEISTKIKEKIRQFNLDKSVFWDNTFVSNEKMKSLFDQSYCVLMPYKNPEASSGILGHAAMSFTPVIGPSVGLVGELIKTHNLGFGVEDCTPMNIAKAINISLTNKFIKNKINDKFIKNHKSHDFSEVVVGQGNVFLKNKI